MIFLILSALLISNVFAHPESAARKENTDYSFYESNYRRTRPDKEMLVTPLGKARYFRSMILPHATGWKSAPVLQQRFEELRNLRFLPTNSTPEILRRISWLYPDDGCFARAAMFNRNAFRMFVPVPDKIFVFGNLKVKTPYSKKGYVSWWYHVAPIIQVKGQKYILDPAIEAKRPLLLNEWLERMGDPAKIKVVICSSGTYSPGDNCNKETNGLELTGEESQHYYLNLEYRRVKSLGLIPENVLADEPPWINLLTNE